MDGQFSQSPGAEGLEGASMASVEVPEATVEAPKAEETLTPDISVMDRQRSNNDQDPHSLQSIYKEFKESTRGTTEGQSSELARLVVLNLLRNGTLLLPAKRHDMINPIRTQLDQIAKREGKTVDQIATFKEMGNKKGDNNVAVEITLIDPRQGERYRQMIEDENSKKQQATQQASQAA